MARCKATKQNGERCRRNAGESGWCPMHDPDPSMQARMAEARRRGGAKLETITDALAGEPPVTLDRLIEVVAATLQQVRTGECDHLRGQTVAGLAKELSRLIEIRDARNNPDAKKATEDSVQKMSDAELAAMMRTQLRLLGVAAKGNGKKSRTTTEAGSDE